MSLLRGRGGAAVNGGGVRSADDRVGELQIVSRSVEAATQGRNLDEGAAPSSPLPELVTMGNNGVPAEAFPLENCQGDCDGDEDCAEGLECYHRHNPDEGTYEDVFGCSGPGNAKEDYCAVHPSTHLFFVDTGKMPLGRCEGDCESDGDCDGDLLCFQRRGPTEYAAVPGCDGNGRRGTDYCYSEEAGPEPTPEPTPKPTDEPTKTPTEAPADCPPGLSLVHAVNSGGSEQTAADGHTYAADKFFLNGAASGAQDGDPYRSERYASNRVALHYAFPEMVVGKMYKITFKFAEIWSGITGPGQRVFDIAVEGGVVHRDVDVYGAVGPNAPYDLEHVYVAGDNVLNVDFLCGVQNAKVAAILVEEVLPCGDSPTAQPTVRPTNLPTTQIPTKEPTPNPTDDPTPTSLPTMAPTPRPTAFPTGGPSESPTVEPTTGQPTQSPVSPTAAPTLQSTVEPTKSPTNRPTPSPMQATELVEVGNNGEPAEAFPLQACQGDCDRDSECAGDLVCFQRSGTTPVPGCNGVGRRNTDYCHYRVGYTTGPNSNPTPQPTHSPTISPLPGPTLGPTLETISDIPGLAQSEHYRIRVRSKNSATWLDSFAFITRSKKDNDQRYYFEHMDGWTNTYTNFVMTQPVEVEISAMDGSDIGGISTAVLHPKASKVAEQAEVRDGKAYVVMNGPAQIVVDINGQMDGQHTGRGYKGPPIHTVTIFANPPLSGVPELGAPGVYAVAPGQTPPADGNEYDTLYFLPGVHDIDRAFPIWKGKTYYLPLGAIVYGTLDSTHVPYEHEVRQLRGREGERYKNGNNIRIFGYGTLSGARLSHPQFDTRPLAQPTPVLMEGAHNSTLEGITIEDSAYHSVMMWAGYKPDEPTIVRWVKIFTWRANGDGINPGTNMRIEHSFLRTQDDAVYARGVGMKGLVIWNDVNGAAFAMWALKEDKKPLIIEDCDVVYSRKLGSRMGGRVFSMRGGGSARVIGGGDVIFRNIRVDDPFPTYQNFFLASARDIPDLGNSPDVGQGLTGVLFQNISITAASTLGRHDILHGHPDSPISNVTFENVRISDKRIDSLAHFSEVNEYVTDIRFR